MASSRWSPQALVFSALLVSPLFGCATGIGHRVPSVTLALRQPVLRQQWREYQQLLDQRIAGQWSVAQLDAGQPDITRLAAMAPEQQVFDQRVLAAHNREREDLGLVPLRWNPALARSARRWADYLAVTGRFEHAPENYAAPQGENLWAGTKGYFSPEAMVNAWIREKKNFRPGTFPDNSTTGRVEDVGHYTQVVWRATTQVGCAEARSRSEDILVCRYAEAGNYRGEVPF
jgi:uncharacterized protein YkwD